MRHANKNNHLGRTASHREAMLSNMAASLILHKRISTTLAKAKELRKYIEPLITRGKEDSTHSRRVVFSYLQNKFAVTELFRNISQKVGDRPGGYTRILKTGFRKGDNAEMCIIELVDYNETYTTSDDKKKTTRTRRGRGKAKTEEQKTPPASTEVVDTITEEKVIEQPVEEVVEGVDEDVVEEVVEGVAEEAVEKPVEEVVEEPIAETVETVVEEVEEDVEKRSQ
jgi:large subunit ribosomal protein L17